MKRIVAGVLASIAVVGLLTACGDDPKVTVPTDGASAEVTLPQGVTIPEGITIPDVTIPDGVTIPAGGVPSDLSIPAALIDQMVAQFEAAGMKVDKDCLTNLLSDESLRNLVAASGTPSPEVMQKFLACLKA